MNKNKIPNNRSLQMKTFIVLAIIFSLCILTQVLLAGLAIFDHSINWIRHTFFVHLFDKIAIVMLLIAFFGKLPKWAKGYSAILVVLVFSMYFTANITAIFPWVGALHPVLAVLMFWVTITALKRSMQYIKKNTEVY